MKDLNNEQKGAALVIASALVYGFLYYFGANIMRENYSPYNVMFWRFLTASSVLFLVLLPRLQKIRVTKKQIFLPLITSAPFHGTATSLYFLSSTYIGGGPAEVLLFTHPVVVLLFNRFVNNAKIAKVCYVAIAFIICGIALLADFGGATFNLEGILIGLAAAIFFGFYIVASKSNTAIDPVLSAFLVCFGSVIICLIFALTNGSFLVPNSAKIWFNIFCLGAFCTALPIMLFLKGLRFIASEKAAIISMLEPPMLILVSYILLTEKVTLMQFCGILVISISTLVVLIKK